MKKVIIVMMLCVGCVVSAWAASDTYKVDLTVWERLNLSMLVPKKGSFEKVIIAVDLKKKIDLTQEEIELYRVESKGGQVTWSPEAEQSKTIIFSYLEMEMLKDEIKRMSDKGDIKASEQFIDMLKKIKEAKPEEKMKE